MSYKGDREIVDTFLQESREHLEEIEQGILILERDQQNEIDPDLVHSIFRAAHSIKAGANLLEFRNIEAIAHELEEILQKVRLGEFQMDGDHISHFLSGIDKLNELLDNIHYCDLIKVDSLLNLLNSITR